MLLSSAAIFSSLLISVDPDQTAPVEQSDLGLHCLPLCLHLSIILVNFCLSKATETFQQVTKPDYFCCGWHF